jgi:DNA-directed RNA polymerase subunit RPC12/RpoP
MPATLIIQCARCSGLLLAAKTQKTHTCPYCGVRIELRKTKPVACAENAFEASEILRKLKAQRKSNAQRFKQK